MFTCPVTQAAVAANHPYPLPYGSTRAICPDYAGATIDLPTLTRVLGTTVPGPTRATTPEEKRAQKDAYRSIINELMVGYPTDPRTTPEVPIAHRRTVILVKDVAAQHDPSAREKRTVISDPTVLHAIDAFTKGYLDVPRAMMATWADLYSHHSTTHADDVLAPEYLEFIKEGWAADPTMVTYSDLNWDMLPDDALALYGYTIEADDARAIAQAAQA